MRRAAVLGIQARCGSTRLPGKVLADVAGVPLVMRVVQRARACALVDEVVVLTSDEPADAPLVELLEERGVPLRRGPLDDVLAPYLALAEAYDPAFVVRATVDRPLLEPHFVDLQLAALASLEGDLVHLDGDEDGVLEGTLGGQAALSVDALRLAADSDDPRDREHPGSFASRTHAERLRFVEVEVEPGYAFPGLRLAVDTAADLELVRAVFAHFGDAPFTTLDALRWLRGRPELLPHGGEVRGSADDRARAHPPRDRTVPVVGRWPS